MRVAILPTGGMELLGVPLALKALFPAHDFDSTWISRMLSGQAAPAAVPSHFSDYCAFGSVCSASTKKHFVMRIHRPPPPSAVLLVHASFSGREFRPGSHVQDELSPRCRDQSTWNENKRAAKPGGAPRSQMRRLLRHIAAQQIVREELQ